MHRHARFVAIVTLVGASALGSACSSAPSSATADATTVSTVPASVTSAAPSTTLALTPAGTTYGVGRTDVTLVDSTRDTDADEKNDVPAVKGRTLETVLLYPTTDPADDATDADHPVAEGRFPLVVFSHGVTASGPAYVGLLKNLAAAGYVVALPTYPLTSGPKGWDNLGQTVNQPTDVSFIIDELLARSAGGDDLLADHLSPDAVGIGGHSLGAITSVLFYNTCCRDPRVAAVAAISGIPFPGRTDADSYDDPPATPLLLLHGEKDTTLEFDGGSKKIFAELTDVPRAMVQFPEAGHVDILTSPSTMPSLLAFFDLTLRHDPTRWQALGAEIATNDDASVSVAGGLPEPS